MEQELLTSALLWLDIGDQPTHFTDCETLKNKKIIDLNKRGRTITKAIKEHSKRYPFNGRYTSTKNPIIVKLQKHFVIIVFFSLEGLSCAYM